MIVQFVGGPMDGETRELQRNQWEWRVTVRRPSDFKGVTWREEDQAVTAMKGPTHRVGVYRFSWETYKMHWNEPKEETRD